MGLPEGNKAIWTPSPVKGMTGDKGLASDGSVQSECQGCLPAHSSTDACQKGVVHQCIGGGNTSWWVSPHPQGARLALRLIRQGDGILYPVGQALLEYSLPFLLTSMADKELLRASKALGVVHVYAQRSYGTQQCRGWVCLLRGQCLQVHHLITEGRGGNLGHVSRGLRTTWE